MLLSRFIALDRELTDLARPTKRGTTIWGKTTTSLSGRSGSEGFCSVSFIFFFSLDRLNIDIRLPA
jgi:hypothetical protein